MNKVLIFGAGFLGHRIKKEIPDSLLSFANINDRQAVKQQILRAHPSPTIIINAAGKTGRPNVDWCESNAFETFQSNVTGPLILAEEATKIGAYLLHLGSGCIFYGPSPSSGGWKENDFANPISTYSRSKYAADLLLGRMQNIGIARLRMPIDHIPSSRNLITKLAAYKEIIDVENSVTIVDDLIIIIKAMIQHRAKGIFHATNPGIMRHTELLSLYCEFVDPSHRYTLISEKELVSRGLALKARSNCILSNSRLEELGICIRPIDVALRDVMQTYAANMT